MILGHRVRMMSLKFFLFLLSLSLLLYQQVEIDEYQNYSKALGALNEALKCLGKAKPKNQTAHEAKIKFMKERIDLVQRFADARR